MGNLKEYLRKNNDGEYILEVTNEREAQEPHAKHWIEVPKGCDYLISVFGVNSFIDSDVFAKVKPKNVLWSRKPMKEYLRKNSNGTYSYIGTVRPEHVSDFMIEIPDGAEVATKADIGISFWKDSGVLWWSRIENKWCKHLDLNHHIEKCGHDIIWQRSSLSEELPFIDDEPSLGNSKIGRRAITVKIPVESLNDQYAEIETVRQSHRTASEIADSALKQIRERAETYDQPTGERSAAKTAKAFNAITGRDITESEVWLLLQLLKDVRQWSREDYHQDSAEDCIAYAALKAESLECVE